ncbi:MAG: hypothetical protein OXU69_07240 [Gemmatimonadota bacterium]|nr:hypothetical protein [Gemmatimonadota bacterium]MDE2984485.1 hypothetical protein [Gemmatimonadota bacterium]
MELRCFNNAVCPARNPRSACREPRSHPSESAAALRPPTLTCGPPAPLSPPDDLLVIATVTERGVLIPIARYADGTWDRPPWAGTVDMDRIAASPAGGTGWRWPDGRRTWHHPGRAWDTIGQPGHAVAVGVPDTWHTYSGTEPDPTLTTLGLSIVRGSCYIGERRSTGLKRTISWAVRTRDPERPAYAAAFDAPVGLALSRPPTAVLSAADAPDPRQIQEQLRREDPGGVSPSARFRWLGTYRFEDMRVGVLGHVGPTTGVMYAVVELHSDQPRVVLTVRRRERCSSEPEPTPQAPSQVAGDQASPAPDALWIAIADRLQGILVPVARYQDDSWDNPPWTGLFPVERLAASRSGDGVWSWPDASMLWDHSARDSDTLGRAPEVIATGVPASWVLHSPRNRGLPLFTTGLRVVMAHCDERWGIRTNLDTLPAFDDDRFENISGIVFSRPPSAVLSEGDIPALDRITEDLGFVDRLRDGEGYRRFHWLGLFRFDEGGPGTAILGVLQGDYYEGRGYMIIRIDGDRGRVVARASEGGC